MGNRIPTQMRMKYFSLLIILYIALHMMYASLHPNIYGLTFYIVNILFVLGFLFFYLMRDLPSWSVYLFVLGINFYVVYEYSVSSTYIYIIFLAYPILLAAYFQLLPLIFVVMVATYIELFFILAFISGSFSTRLTKGDMELLLFFFFLLLSTTILHIWIERRVMTFIQSQNQLMKSQLLSKEGYLRLFFDTARDGIAVFDLDNRLIDLNPAFEELYGYKRQEVIGKQVFFFPPHRVNEAIELTNRIRAGESFNHLQTQDMRKDGTLIDVQLTLSPIHNKKGDIIAMSVISRDISLQKEAERLKLETEKLHLAGEIAAGVAHEIRNPMTIISGFIQMMNEHKDSPSYRYTSLIESEIKRIEYIISEFLLLSKPTPSPEDKFLLRDILNDVLTLFEHQIKANDIKLHHEWNAHNSWLQGDAAHIKQVVINLVKNAIESMSSQRELHLYSYSKNHVDYIVVIRDTGTGMTEEVIENLFKPFYTTKAEGFGLGMMICQKIMADVGGRIEVQSQPGKGTTVYLHFKKAKESSGELNQKS
ncbi:nitrogen regulation protein NR(II) [Chryseomicrobium palamuruense]|uniref:histidine kinase n=1 Tax=Chryseomicrobium palamuruense TaxID=682973 RepID=A0ABV8USW0_9BACL